MDNNYEIIRTIFENGFQRILECKNNKSQEIFFNNIIISTSAINLIDIDGLKSLYTNIIDCYKTEDRIYIMTKQMDIKKLREYVCENDLTLKQQFNISKKIIELSSNIYNMKDIVQKKILDYENIYIDNDQNLCIDCNFILEQEYDISDNQTFKRMGNILHYIFSRSDIDDYNISELVPPDVLKIIVRCLTKEYTNPKDTLREFTKSPIYCMIFNIEDESKKKNISDTMSIYIDKKDIATKINIRNKDENKDENDALRKSFTEDDSNDSHVIDIYLNENNKSDELTGNNEKEKDERKQDKQDKQKNVKNLKPIAIIVVCAVIVLLLGNFVLKKMKTDEEVTTGDKVGVVKPNGTGDKNTTDAGVQSGGTDENKEPESIGTGDTTDTTSKFFNKDLIEKIGYKGNLAQIDKDIYLEGNESLVIKNETEDTIKSLFSVIDFNDSTYSYMLKKQISITGKIKSENDMDAHIVLEAYKDGKLSSTLNTKVKLYNDMWSPVTIPINVANTDELHIYLEYTGVNKVWIDAVYIDVVK